jgi:hypothetical protein
VRIAIVASPLANKPLSGGHAWVPLSFAVGLRRLGFDVYLVEQIDSGVCVDAGGGPASFAESINRSFFIDVTDEAGFAGRRALISDGGRESEGFDLERLREIAADADLLVNISGHARLDGLVSGPRARAYIDMDPGFTQHWNRSGLLPEGIRDHEFHFSVAANIGAPDCGIPADGLDWKPIVQPVVLDDWPTAEGGGATEAGRFTTVATWRCPSGLVSFDGITFPDKLHEFRRLQALPSVVERRFEIALDIHPGDVADRDRLEANGWQLVEPRVVAGDPERFRDYVLGSGAEFSAAQGVYVGTNSGWFSDRSVRYLAAGRPVLVQDTGFAPAIPEGEGVVAFATFEEARLGAACIAAEYAAHAAAARRIAETVFDSDIVLGRMCDQMGISN